MNPQKPFSVRKNISRVFRTILLVFGAASLVYLGFTTYYSAKSVLREFSAFMDNYLENLSSALEVESEFNRTIVSSDPNFALLATEGTSDAAWLPPFYNLRRVIYYHDNAYCVSMLVDSHNGAVYYYSNLFPTEGTQPYRTAYHQIGENALEESALFGQWFHVSK